MRRRHRLRRKNLKKRRALFIIGLFSITFLFASGYAAFSTALNINAKGNLINIPKISPSDLIDPENIVTTGDGLYADPVETNRYVYKGANPNNYITIGNEEYRIMAIEPDGTLKVIKNETIGNFPWDPGYSDSISGITESNSVTGTRWTTTSTDFCYYSTSTTLYFGCKSWGSSTTTLDSSGVNVTVMPRVAGNSTTYNLPSTEAYLNTYLNTTYINNLLSNIDINKRDKIINHLYNIGSVKNTSGQTLATDITQEETYKWRGKVGLMTVTDYVKGSTNSACTSVREYSNTSGCYSNSTTHNYLAKSYGQWTMSPDSSSDSRHVWCVYSSGFILSNTGANSSTAVRPVLYLSSDILLKGSGTPSDKYELA